MRSLSATNSNGEFSRLLTVRHSAHCDFKRRTREVTDAPVSYGLIPRDHWYQPDSIDEEKATAAREQMVKNNVIYGGSVPYVSSL